MTDPMNDKELSFKYLIMRNYLIQIQKRDHEKEINSRLELIRNS